MRILGIVTDSHDSGVAIIENGVPLVVIEEERLNREKHTKVFPDQALAAALAIGGLSISDIAAVTTPWRAAEIRRSFWSAIKGRFPASLNLLRQSAHTPQDNAIVLLDWHIPRNMRRVLRAGTLPPLIQVGHHDSHAAMYFVSPFEEAHVLVMDGYGDDGSTSVYSGAGNRLTRHWHTSLFNSLGMVYTLLTQHLGFAGFSDEGKVMALAAFGDDRYVARFRELIRLTDDGRYAIDMSWFDYDAYGLLSPFKRKFIETFGPARVRGGPLTDHHKALAFALQAVCEEVVLHVVRGMTRQNGSRNLVMTGGVALNCVANAKILAHTDIERIWVPPCASDSGAPLGSTLFHRHQTLGQKRTFELTHPYYGQGYDEAACAAALGEAGLQFDRLTDAELMRRTAHDLAASKIVAWFQGRFEMGPRALGNRSILADPRRIEMKDLINAKVKQRESFRPFAPAVLIERAAEFFEIDQPDPFMTLAPRIRPDKVHLIPAAQHVDGTGRIQTVAREANPRYYGVIEAFGKLTGVPVLLNTSFNRQEPIVSRPSEAISCFLRTGMDVLVLGNLYVANRTAEATAKAEREFSRS